MAGLPVVSPRTVRGVGVLVVQLWEDTFGIKPAHELLQDAFAFHLAEAAQHGGDAIVVATDRPEGQTTRQETALDLSHSRLTSEIIGLLEREVGLGFVIPGPQRARLAALVGAS